MADVELENEFGIVDKRKVQGGVGAAGTFDNSSSYNSVSRLRVVLSTRNAGYYTTAKLNQMTKNDMVYALRTIDDAAGI